MKTIDPGSGNPQTYNVLNTDTELAIFYRPPGMGDPTFYVLLNAFSPTPPVGWGFKFTDALAVNNGTTHAIAVGGAFINGVDCTGSGFNTTVAGGTWKCTYVGTASGHKYWQLVRIDGGTI